MRKQPRKQPSEAATASFANLRHLLPFLDNERRVAGQVNRKTRVTVEDCTLRVPESILAQSRTGLVVPARLLPIAVIPSFIAT
jgi:hypothetical protein